MVGEKLQISNDKTIGFGDLFDICNLYIEIQER